ncbi:hypothetical protein [Pseudobdellovibrio exovorus]|uniref:Uncharacterized protein n=1 Tax=Pseudobdellovibrio exovorus JSS TaxID=1184267 RepID=M4VBF5_9BACT|nr:hypothetical protein [Pseudobdellovibrio exovorus]AGH95356.1 hypothetical protein A11Q_1140 [Pseudobdellovibrio exovorus JSS]
MRSKKKSDDINKHYPLLGFRVTKADKAAFSKNFTELIDKLQSQPEYKFVNLKKNAVFLRALELGIEQIKRKKSLG